MAEQGTPRMWCYSVFIQSVTRGAHFTSVPFKTSFISMILGKKNTDIHTVLLNSMKINIALCAEEKLNYPETIDSEFL